MSRSKFHQDQTGSSLKDAAYIDSLVNALDATTAETGDNTNLIAAESITFSAAGSTLTFGTSNPLTSGVIPGDIITITGSTSDDGEYIAAAPITSTTVDISTGTFTAADGGSATGAIDSKRDLLSDLNLLRSQVRRLTGESNWFDPPTAANSPILSDKKLIYTIVDKTDIAIPTAAFADISALGLTPYADSSVATAEGIMASTTAPIAGGLKKSEGPHFVDLVDAATGAPLTISGFRVYGYVILTGTFSVPVTERIYFVYFDEPTDAEVLVTNLSTEIDNSATNFEIVYNNRTNLGAVPEDFALFPGFEVEPQTDIGISLQNAYAGGNTIDLVDTEGDLVIQTDETGSIANFVVRNEAGTANYFSTDATNDEAEIGSASIAVSLLGDTTVETGNTFGVTDGQSTFGGNVDANSGLDVNGTTNLGDGGTTNYSQFNATGDLSLVGTADTIQKTDGNLTVQATGAGNDLILAATDILDLDGTTVNIDASGAFSLDGALASNINITGANLDIGTLTSGDLNLSSAGDLTFNDSTWAGGGGTPDPLDFSDASNTNLSGFTTAPVSLIDAINQSRAAVAGLFSRAFSVPGNTPKNTDITLPGAISYADATDFVDNIMIFRNGQYLRPGSSAAANFDVYPGSTLTTFRAEFPLGNNDTIGVIKITP